jgi:polyhydroxyalkanoate synthase
VGGRPVDPRYIKIPSLIVAPKQDYIVPNACAKALANTLANAEILEPDAGHVGMVVGSKSQEQLWQPMLHWLNTNFAT